MNTWTWWWCARIVRLWSCVCARARRHRRLHELSEVKRIIVITIIILIEFYLCAPSRDFTCILRGLFSHDRAACVCTTCGTSRPALLYTRTLSSNKVIVQFVDICNDNNDMQDDDWLFYTFFSRALPVQTWRRFVHHYFENAPARQH